MSRHAANESGFGFEHADTSTPRRTGLIWAIASVLAVLALVGGFVAWRGGVFGCKDEPVTVAADPAFAGPLKDVAEAAAAGFGMPMPKSAGFAASCPFCGKPPE